MATKPALADNMSNLSLAENPHSHCKGHGIPSRAILSPGDLERFQTCQTYTKFTAFLEHLNESVRNQKLTSQTFKSPVVEALVTILDTVQRWIDEIPPQDVGLSRFGNASFKTWYDRLESEIDGLLEPIVDSAHRPEVATYFKASFGSPKRIDYGTGHEASFMCFLFCFYELGLLSEKDSPAVVMSIFWGYIGVMRQLQLVYWLEPAGSHGVWGLDDYHFLPFYFGASQLAGILVR